MKSNSHCEAGIIGAQRRPSIASHEDPVFIASTGRTLSESFSSMTVSPSNSPSSTPVINEENVMPVKGRSTARSTSDRVERSRSPKVVPVIEKVQNHEAKRKTEMCKYWKNGVTCTYGNSCMYAHGPEELQPKIRNSRFKTEICEDPAIEGTGRCRYMRPSENRCNYVHPGEALRLEMDSRYLEKDYATILKQLGTRYPRGIYL